MHAHFKLQTFLLIENVREVISKMSRTF